MFVARDQENLVHSRQTAAAAKPQNQGLRGLAPKTPGNKSSFRIPVKDENAQIGAIKGGKSVLKGASTFATPLATKNRAILGAKSTNGKIKGFEASGRSVKTGLKPQLKPIAPVLSDAKVETNDPTEVPDIEYMPPRPKNLPDHPDDLPELNLSLLKPENMLSDLLREVILRTDDQGLTHFDREEIRKQEAWAILEQKHEAEIQLQVDSLAVPCHHEPECPGEVCKDTVVLRKKAQETYDKTMAQLDAEAGPKRPGKISKLKSTGPSIVQSRAAASALSYPATIRPRADPTKQTPAAPAKRNFAPFASRVNQAKNMTRGPLATPSIGSPLHHPSTVARSRSTIGHAKGRAISGSLRRTQEHATVKKGTKSAFVPFDDRDTSVSPQEYISRYGEPPLESRMWMRCWRSGLLPNDDTTDSAGVTGADASAWMDERLREDALDDFQLVF